MSDYSHGLSKGVAMSNAECLRFCNGIIAAINDPIHIRQQISAQGARLAIEPYLDLLADQGMTATVGHAGTAIIKPLHGHE